MDADLELVRSTTERKRAAQEELIFCVKKARRRGRSWSVIGFILGTSRQAASKRFSKYCEE